MRPVQRLILTLLCLTLPLFVSTLANAHLADETTSCTRQQAWMPTRGSLSKQTKQLITSALASTEFVSRVDGIVYGEKNGCNQSITSAIAIQVALSDPSGTRLNEATADHILTLLQPLDLAPSISLSLESTQTGETLLRTPTMAHRKANNTTQVNARQGWQATGIQLTAGSPIRLTVTDGRWTHWVGSYPHNN